MHQSVSSDDPAPEGLSYALMTEADPKNGDLTREAVDQGETDSSLVGVAGPGRNDQPIKGVQIQFFSLAGVVAPNLHLHLEFPEVLHQVVGEGIVVIENEEAHGMVGLGGGVALFARALLESESIESDEPTCILGPVIAFIIIHGCDFQIIEGEIGFSSHGGEVTFV